MTDKPEAVKTPLKTVDRALCVLVSFSERRTDWGVLELAEHFDIDKSVAQRLLAALTARGFLRANPVTHRYSLGPTMWRMASLWERTGGLARLAEDVLVKLGARTERTSTFSVPDGFHVRCIAAIDGGNMPIRDHPLVGDIYPAHTGATSRAYFASLDASERRALLSGRPFPKYTDYTEVDAMALEKLFEQAARDGWVYSEGEYDSHTRAIAAPVRLGRRPVGSLTVVESKADDLPGDIRDYVQDLLDASEELGDLLAHRTRASARRRSSHA